MVTRTMRFIGTAVASAVLSVGCGQFGAMFDLQKEITEEFKIGTPAIEISNGKHLKIGFTNADIGESSRADLKELARRIAEFARDNYRDYDDIETVSVSFQGSSQYGPVNVTKTKGHFSFQKSELGDRDEDGE